MTVSVCGEWVEEIYKSIKKKEEAIEKKEFDEMMAKNAKIGEDKKAKEGENNTIYEKDPGMMV